MSQPDDTLELRERMHEGTTDVAQLLRMIRSGDNCVWAYAAHQLGRHGADAAVAVDSLLHFIRDDEGRSTHLKHDGAVIAAIHAVASIAPDDANVRATLRDIADAREYRWRSSGAEGIVVQIRFAARFALEQIDPVYAAEREAERERWQRERTARAVRAKPVSRRQHWWQFWRPVR